MGWERRLREMILAGGALAAACGDDSAGNGADTSADMDAGNQGNAPTNLPNVCCNANPDPCCTCSDTVTYACRQEMQCKANGTWNWTLGICVSTSDSGDDTGPGAEAEAEARDEAVAGDAAGDADAGGDSTEVSRDASIDAAADVISAFCCNANGDPCCTYLYCGAPLTTECSKELACQADGGTWDFYSLPSPDGSVTPPHCEPGSEAGASDAHGSPD